MNSNQFMEMLKKAVGNNKDFEILDDSGNEVDLNSLVQDESPKFSRTYTPLSESS